MIVNQIPYPLSFSQEKGQTLIARYGEEGRQYVMHPDVDVSGLVASLQIVKPDNTFVIASADIVEPEEGPSYIVCTIPLQATAVKGIGHYSLYIQDDADMIIYSAEGKIWVDDHLITDEMIESVAAVYGLRFPQDFLTVENLVDIVAYVSANLIKDDIVADDTTWSSQKINAELSHIEPEPVTATEQGNPLTITDAAETPFVECVATIEATQDLHGYGKPWVGGAGSNKWDEEWENGAYNSSGAKYIDTNKIRTKNKISVENYPTIFFCCTYVQTTHICFYDVLENFVSDLVHVGNNILTIPTGVAYMTFNMYNAYGDTYNNNIAINYPATVTTYSPYSNICPISGLSSIDVNIAASGIDIPETFSADLGETIYGGSVELIHGEKTKTWGYIASYNGESLPGVWLSDRDGYEPGTNPTTGAEVAYELAGPLSSSISPLVIKTLLGNNYITTNAKTLSLEYITQFWDPLVYHGKIYSTNEQILGKWIDGSDIYERVYPFVSPISISASGTIITSLIDNISEIDKIRPNCVAFGEHDVSDVYINFNAGVMTAYLAEGMSYCSGIILRYSKTT